MEGAPTQVLCLAKCWRNIRERWGIWGGAGYFCRLRSLEPTLAGFWVNAHLWTTTMLGETPDGMGVASRRSCLVVLFALTLACTRQEPMTESSPPPLLERSPRWDESERRAEREALVRRSLQREGISDQRVLDALRRVPRHRFVPEELAHEAYLDRPLPIGSGQTISQPYIVALMSEAAGISPTDRCLEIGTGSGYQAAVLALLCAEVFSIEYRAELFEFARRNLESLGLGVRLRHGDGYLGWPTEAPFDVILVTAAPTRVPKPLLEQLALGGRLVIPVGPVGAIQSLERWRRRAHGAGHDAFVRETLADVRFVPFVGNGGVVR